MPEKIVISPTPDYEGKNMTVTSDSKAVAVGDDKKILLGRPVVASTMPTMEEAQPLPSDVSQEVVSQVNNFYNGVPEGSPVVTGVESSVELENPAVTGDLAAPEPEAKQEELPSLDIDNLPNVPVTPEAPTEPLPLEESKLPEVPVTPEVPLEPLPLEESNLPEVPVAPVTQENPEETTSGVEELIPLDKDNEPVEEKLPDDNTTSILVEDVNTLSKDEKLEKIEKYLKRLKTTHEEEGILILMLEEQMYDLMETNEKAKSM